MTDMGNLRERAAGTDVATTNKPDAEAAQAHLRTEIARMEEQFQLAMPKGVEATQLVRDAITCLRQTPKLAECDPKSVLGSLMTCAQLGLRVGVLGHAWVLPFWDKKSHGFKAQLIIGYQGLVELAHRSGKVSSLIARTIHEKDTWEVAYGLEDSLVHKPYMGDDGRGDPVAYYAVVKLTSGGRAFIVMTKREAEEHRNEHAMARTKDGRIVGPWRDDFDAMALKTCVIKLAKWMPKSTDMARAIEADEGVRVDLSPDKTAEEVTHHYRTPDTIEGQLAKTDEEPAQGEAPKPAKKSAAKKAAAAPEKSSVDDLFDKIAASGQQVGMDAMALESVFAEQNNGDDIREANAEQLQTFLTWVEDQSDPGQVGEDAAPADEAPQS